MNLVVFDMPLRDSREEHQRELDADLKSASAVPFYRTKDYLSQTSVNLDEVMDFTSERIYVNDTVREVTCARLEDGLYTPYLLISFEDFRQLLERTRGVRARNVEDILEEYKDF